MLLLHCCIRQRCWSPAEQAGVASLTARQPAEIQVAAAWVLLGDCLAMGQAQGPANDPGQASLPGQACPRLQAPTASVLLLGL